MHIGAAARLRDEFFAAAQAVISTNSLKSRLSLWARNEFGFMTQRVSLHVSVGILAGQTADDAGIAVRSTVPLDQIGGFPLRELRNRADKVDIVEIQPGQMEQGSTGEGPMDLPMRIGSFVGHGGGGRGTLGAFVRERGSSKIGILSNNHVLANVNGPGGAYTYFISKQGPKVVGKLADNYPRLKGLDEINVVDAACSWIDVNPQDPGDIAGRLRLSGRIVEPRQRMPVYKFGHATGWTKGEIRVFGCKSVVLGNDKMNCRFDNEIEIQSGTQEPFSATGDSGALVVTGDGDAVGLLVGGMPNKDGSKKLTYANPIRSVLDALGVELHWR